MNSKNICIMYYEIGPIQVQYFLIAGRQHDQNVPQAIKFFAIAFAECESVEAFFHARVQRRNFFL